MKKLLYLQSYLKSKNLIKESEAIKIIIKNSSDDYYDDPKFLNIYDEIESHLVFFMKKLCLDLGKAKDN